MKITGAYGGAAYNLSVTSGDSDNSLKELVSGKKINSAADGASELAISSKLEAQAKEFAAKVRNLQTQNSFYQVGDTGLSSIGEDLNSLRELAVQSQNGTYTADDQSILQQKADSLLKSIDQTATGTEFNTQKVLAQFNSGELGLSNLVMTSNETMDKIDAALKKVSEKRGEFGSQVSAIGSEITKLRVAQENSVAANSRIEDSDMLLATMNNTRQKIMDDANLAVVSQANKVSVSRVQDMLKD